MEGRRQIGKLKRGKSDYCKSENGMLYSRKQWKINGCQMYGKLLNEAKMRNMVGEWWGNDTIGRNVSHPKLTVMFE